MLLKRILHRLTVLRLPLVIIHWLLLLLDKLRWLLLRLNLVEVRPSLSRRPNGSRAAALAAAATAVLTIVGAGPRSLTFSFTGIMGGGTVLVMVTLGAEEGGTKQVNIYIIIFVNKYAFEKYFTKRSRSPLLRRRQLNGLLGRSHSWNCSRNGRSSRSKNRLTWTQTRRARRVYCCRSSADIR